MTQAAVPGVPAKATQGAEAQHRDFGWAEASIWTDRTVSALANGVTGGKWFSLADKVIRPSTLEAAWRQVARTKEAAGADGQSVERFAAAAERYLSELHQTLKTGRYRPSPVRRVDIPKSGGGTRPLGIPTVKSLPQAKAADRIVQTALNMAIEPIPRVRPLAGPRTCFEAEFGAGSYGFRPGRGCKSPPPAKAGDALREVEGLLKAGYVHVVDADLQSYFDTIPHDRLMVQVAQKISDGRVLALIEGCLSHGVMKEMEHWRPTAGTPQGAVISPLLANIYLHPLDRLMAESGYRMVRYADDFVILCRTAQEAQAALRRAMAWVAMA